MDLSQRILGIKNFCKQNQKVEIGVSPNLGLVPTQRIDIKQTIRKCISIIASKNIISTILVFIRHYWTKTSV